MTSRKLKLYFKDDLANAKSFTIDYPKEEYANEEVKASMDKIVNSKVLVTKNGPIAAKTKAQIETVNKEDIDIA